MILVAISTFCEKHGAEGINYRHAAVVIVSERRLILLLLLLLLLLIIYESATATAAFSVGIPNAFVSRKRRGVLRCMKNMSRI